MKTAQPISDRPTYQGDVMIVRVDEIPESAMHDELRPDVEGNLVVAHSETGHHHVVAAKAARVWRATAMLAYMRVVAKEAELRHLRPTDTHETGVYPTGDWAIIRQREGALEGWRQVQD